MGTCDTEGAWRPVILIGATSSPMSLLPEGSGMTLLAKWGLVLQVPEKYRHFSNVRNPIVPLELISGYEDCPLESRELEFPLGLTNISFAS